MGGPCGAASLSRPPSQLPIRLSRDRCAEVPARVDLAKSLGDAGVSLAQYRYPIDEMPAFAAAVYGESRTAARNTDRGGGADTETVTKAAAPGLPELAWSGEPDRETTPAEPPQSADEAHEPLATPDDRRPYSFSWRDTRMRAAPILLGAAAVVGVVVLVGALVPQDHGAPTKEPTASPVAVPAVVPVTVTAAPLPAPTFTVTPPRVIGPTPTQIFMETTEPAIEPPVPAPSIPTVPPHGYVPIQPPDGRVPILTPAPGDPCRPNC